MAEQMMVPRHCWPFFALFCGGNNGSSAKDGRNYQGSGCVGNSALVLLGIPSRHAQPQQLQRCVQRCATMKGGDSMDDGALARRLFLALLRDGNNVSGTNNSGQ